MDATQILRDLATTQGLPVEAIQAARANRAAFAPAFVQAVERVVDGDDPPETFDAIFLVFHLLGEWREKSAYRPLAALLHLPTEEINELLGGAITETSHRVMAAVFDGDPAPLYEIIHDPDADEYVRSRMLEALAMLTMRGELPREETARFLRACFTELEPQDECFAWDGWQSSIAMLGLVELVPLVKQVFEREFVNPGWLRFEHFEKDLDHALKGDPLPGRSERDLKLFGDTIEELSSWVFADPARKPRESAEDGLAERVVWNPYDDGPAVNPYKGVGRNDPCPCGSGKKFKKCCLDKIDALAPSVSSIPAPRLDADADADDVLLREDVFGDDEWEYDPLVAPDPEAWLDLDEQERIDMVMDFHRRARIKLPNVKAHAVAHAAVENQIAQGDALPVRRTLERLMGEGLDRHDAVHAIGMALMCHINDLLKAGDVEGDPNAPYFAELECLTAEGWRRSG
jgi:hypothetical protein